MYSGDMKMRTQPVTINGESGVYIEVKKESGTNSVKVAENVKTSIDKVNKSLPPGVKLEILYDSTDMIGGVLDTVIKSAIQGLLLAMGILFFFPEKYQEHHNCRIINPDFHAYNSNVHVFL